MSRKMAICAICIGALLALAACGFNKASYAGPDEWTQYRLNSQSNPVYNTDKRLNIADVFHTSNQVRATPVVVNGTLFVGNHGSGYLNAFDLQTGQLLWRSDAPNWVHSEMIYQNGNIYVGYGNRYFDNSVTPSIRGTGPSGVLALDAETGDVRWQFETKGEVMPTPVIYQDTVYVVTGGHRLYAIDSKTGQLTWYLNLGTVVSMSSPNLNDGVLYFGSSLPYTFFAVDLVDQEILWTTRFPKVIAGLDDVSPAIYHDQIVYTSALVGENQHPTHMLYALDIDTGAVIWKKNMGSGNMVQNNKSGAPMVYQGKVFLVSPITKKFYAYDAETGKLLWSYQNDYIAKAPPVAAHGIVYFTDTGGHVFAFDADSGELKGVKKLHGKLAPSGPIIIGHNLIVGSQDGNVYAVPLKAILGRHEYTAPE